MRKTEWYDFVITPSLALHFSELKCMRKQMARRVQHRAAMEDMNMCRMATFGQVKTSNGGLSSSVGERSDKSGAK